MACRREASKLEVRELLSDLSNEEKNMIGVKPYISFPGNCEEALNFYKDCTGGEVLFIQRMGDSPMVGPEDSDKIMHSTLKIGDTIIMAADNCKGPPSAVGDNISMAIGLDTLEDTESIFDKMA